MVPVQFWHISILSPGYIMSLDNTPLAVLLFNVPLWATTVNTSYLTSAFYKLSHKAVRIKPLPVLTESNHTKSHCPVKSLHVFLFMLLWPSLTGIRVWRDSYPTKTSISYSLWRRICTPYSQDFITILWFPLCSEPLCFIQVYLLQTSTFVFAPLEESKPSWVLSSWSPTAPCFCFLYSGCYSTLISSKSSTNCIKIYSKFIFLWIH